MTVTITNRTFNGCRHRHFKRDQVWGLLMGNMMGDKLVAYLVSSNTDYCTCIPSSAFWFILHAPGVLDTNNQALPRLCGFSSPSRSHSGFVFSF